MATRRQFSREFKLEAVRLVKEREGALAQAARDLDLHETVPRTWIRELASDPRQATPPAARRGRQAEFEGSVLGAAGVARAAVTSLARSC